MARAPAFFLKPVSSRGMVTQNGAGCARTHVDSSCMMPEENSRLGTRIPTGGERNRGGHVRRRDACMKHTSDSGSNPEGPCSILAVPEQGAR